MATASLSSHVQDPPPPPPSPPPVVLPPTNPSKQLQCTLCLKEFMDARILPCFHSFCAGCLETSCLQTEEQGSVIFCPVCMDESIAPLSGVQGLPKNLYIHNLLELKKIPPGSLPLKCDLCTDNELAVSRCQMCACFLCEFCNQAHQRQRRTSEHVLVPVELGGGGLLQFSSEPPQWSSDFCKVHPREQLKLFCESCEVPICLECVTEDHHAHPHLPLEDMSLQYSEILRNLLTQTDPLISSLNEAMKSIEFLLSGIHDRVESVAADVCDYIDARMRSLQEHKRCLLSQLDAIKHHKESTLELQLESLKGIMDELDLNCNMASKALRERDTAQLFSVKVPVVANLQDLINAKHDFHPQEDDYVQFRSNLPAGHCGGFQVFGTLDARGPSAAHSVVEGEGLFEARQRKMSSFSVIVYDRYGERRLTGGDKVEAQMHSRSGSIIKTSVTDHGNGTYLVSYTPESVGEHRLSVLVNGKHVRASPFVVNVCPRKKKHRGVFHCCTFCSSEGKKHVRCGCGGTMPGGYSGCGHSHPGHPGCWHWSCCGATSEASDCLL